MRLFVAIEIPEPMRERLRGVLHDLRASTLAKAAAGVRWIPAENLHVTLKFIGETPGEQLEAISGALRKVISPAVPVEFAGLAFSPSEMHARVLWMEIAASAGLIRLAASVEQALESLGIERERRGFTPHLTLARMKNPRVPAELRKAAAQYARRGAWSFQAPKFHLIESKLKSSGAEYTTRQMFPITAEA